MRSKNDYCRIIAVKHCFDLSFDHLPKLVSPFTHLYGALTHLRYSTLCYRATFTSYSSSKSKIMKTLKLCILALFTGLVLNATASGDAEDSFAKAGKDTSPQIKVALLLDTSNSMDGLIDQAKAQLWELVNELSYATCGNEVKPSLQIALYEYGNDDLNAREGYIRQVNGLSDDLDEISQNLFKLSTNGGNEYCGQVIMTSLNQLDWGEGANDLNLIFIAGNEPFDQGPTKYQDAASAACGKDVTINTIFCGDYNQGAATHWKDGAHLTKGDYIAINSDRATVHIPSPYDDKILSKNKALNETYVTYGKLGESKMQLQSVQDSNAASYGEANAVKRALSKSSHFYKNSSWDLVDAEAAENFSYDDLKEEDLPQALKGKTSKEIESYVEQKRKERTTIQKEIAALNEQRKKYVATKTNETDNELRNAMLEAIKKQGKNKDYKWN